MTHKKVIEEECLFFSPGLFPVIQTCKKLMYGTSLLSF